MHFRILAVCAVLPFFPGAGTGLAHDGAMGATKERMDAMSDMGRALKALHIAMRSGDLLDAPDAPLLIEQLRQKGQILPSLFATNEIPEMSDASPHIWDDPEGFGAKIDAFNTGVEELVDAHENRNRAEAGAALRKVTAGCSNCHQAYRTSN